MITVRNLSFSYPRGSRVFEGLSLALPAGEIIGLLGQNGVGKSTLIKLLAALITPQQGEVTFDGKNMITYLNGKAVTKPMAAIVPDHKRNMLCIGATAAAGTGYPFKGAISNVVIYPRALTAEEISNLE